MPSIYIGQRFGRLEVLEYCDPQPDPKHPRWRCRCDCGKETVVQTNNFARTRSCGCLRREELAARSTTHGMSKSPEYHTWADLIARCTNPRRTDFTRYGKSGVMVCRRWLNSFEAFFEDMGKRPSAKHSIDRIDNSRGYEPENCRWATATVQRENQRRTKLYTFNGHTGTLKDLSRRAGISYGAVHQRMTKMNWTLEEALTTPSQRSPR